MQSTKLFLVFWGVPLGLETIPRIMSFQLLTSVSGVLEFQPWPYVEQSFSKIPALSKRWGADRFVFLGLRLFHPGGSFISGPWRRSCERHVCPVEVGCRPDLALMSTAFSLMSGPSWSPDSPWDRHVNRKVTRILHRGLSSIGKQAQSLNAGKTETVSRPLRRHGPFWIWDQYSLMFSAFSPSEPSRRSQHRWNAEGLTTLFPKAWT